MGIAENKQLVLDFYAAGDRGDIDACLAMLADDITWNNIGTTRFSGTFVGKQAVEEKLLGPLFGLLKNGIASRLETLIAEKDVVVALTSGRAETVDGTPYNNTYCQVMRVHDGRIAAVREYFDTALTETVFGSRQ